MYHGFSALDRSMTRPAHSQRAIEFLDLRCRGLDMGVEPVHAVHDDGDGECTRGEAG